jgi:BCD family chlorophyll transporter-like MFS transporter
MLDQHPKIPLYEMFRLGLFQMGLGIMSLLTLGLLNRVMINELAIPPAVAAAMIAIPLFMSPARVWFGQLSDTRPLFNTYRSGYIWLGSVLFTVCAWLAVQVMWRLGQSFYQSGWEGLTVPWLVLLGSLFACYGLALSMSSTPFAALLVDVTDEEERSKLVGIVWSLLMVGIVIGAVTVGKLVGSSESTEKAVTSVLSNPDRFAALQRSVDRIFVLVPAVVVGLSFVSTWGIERRYSRFMTRNQEQPDQIGLGRALQVLTASPQTAKFFTFLLFMTLGLFIQDGVLEPYGGEIFQMSIGETTKLNAPFGIGTLLGISLSGFLIAPRIGKQNTASLGCWTSIGALIGLIGAGMVANVNFLRLGVFLFGLTSGITTTGAISLMLDLTATATAGTFIGAWGLAQAIARGLATFLGGFLLQIGKSIAPTALVAYGLVFTVQAGMLALAIALLSQVNVREFQETTKKAILEVIASEVE